MKIVIIGSGNVAAVLGRKFREAGHQILQVAGRNAKAASDLAYEWDTVSTNYLSAINRNADVYIIAVTDDAIPVIIKDLKLPEKVVAHTAASVPEDILKNVTSHYGVFYPLQSLRKDMLITPEIPVFYNGHDELAKRTLETLAHSISKEKVAVASEDALPKLHVAAVFVSNFPNHLYALAEQYCRKEGLDFKQLIPLIEETANRIRTVSPLQAQTGPALRNDTDTIEKHLAILEQYPDLKKIYSVLTESIQKGK